MMIPLLLGITIISFVVIHLAPGKPTDMQTMLNPEAGSAAKARLEKLYGLDQPIPVQYWNWLKRLAVLDFGRSFSPDRQPVLTKIGRRLPITILINVLSMVLIFIVAIPIGILSATHRNSLFDRATTVFVFVGFATPTFWLALLLMILLGVNLGWLPISGLKSMNYAQLSLWGQFWDRTAHLLLPVLLSAFGGLAGMSRYMRSNMLEVVRQDYITTARAKGLSERVVIYKHALRNALMPVITILGLSVPGLIGGSVIFESIFAIPGMGQLFYQSVMSRDYPMVMGGLVIGAVADLGRQSAGGRGLRPGRPQGARRPGMTEYRSPMREFWRRLRSNRLAIAGGLVVVVLFLVSFLAPWISPYDPTEINVIQRLRPPSLQHLCGTDQLGRDVLSRMIYGARISLKVGFVAVGIATVIGVIFGALAGYYGRWVDSVIMRFVDLMLCFPAFFLILAVIALLEPSIWNIMIVIGVTGWMGVARLVRAEFLTLRSRDFVSAAMAMGASDSRIIFRHILPNALAPVLVAATLGVAGAILTESALSFLGIGVQPPTPSWGNILTDGKDNISIAWWLSLYPGLAILITVLGYNLLGEGIRDSLDPRLQE